MSRLIALLLLLRRGLERHPRRLLVHTLDLEVRTGQRDPGTVFLLSLLRELEAGGAVRLAEDHYAFTGATSQVRLPEQDFRTAPEPRRSPRRRGSVLRRGAQTHPPEGPP